MCENETMKKPIPDILFYVYFTKKELLNINPCRFTNYEDAYNYAIRYDKSLIYTKIIPYKPAVNVKDIIAGYTNQCVPPAIASTAGLPATIAAI